MIDVQNRSYHIQYGCQFTSIIPTNIFGPHDNFNLADSHVIPGLIHNAFFLCQKTTTPFTVKGTGTLKRQFLYSLDRGRLILQILDYYSSPEPEDEVSIAEETHTITNEYQLSNITFDSSYNNGQFRKNG